ncbi:transmembrane amino acid transporter protein-domain-containing protein [Halteromyces radiatus]|uniref:transmembrane amino acid transporter protein-domain-containing protein n=1 Tax=Halteromyces radiatus TaxID=101107 RepID=UPI00221F94BF|nr:transmembrane amino acid transporter protein-domain-containing protein [Halteromyces radiatus]KAI8081557.1 transmembrane amino acid transporter protein-domain-containing protein [Halteromyces radiatus]
MSSPLPVNAKQYWANNIDEESTQPSHSGVGGDNTGILSSSYDRNMATARLTSSPVPPNFSGSRHSPPSGDGSDGLSQRSLGSHTDLEQLFTTGTGLFRPMSTPTYNYEDNTVSADMTDDRIARVVKRHLAGASSPTGSARSASPNNNLSRVNTHNSVGNNRMDHYGSSSQTGSLFDWTEDWNGGGSSSLVINAHQLPGGAITHDIYKWAEDQELEQCKRQRSQSMYIPRQEHTDPALAHLKDPGGFRRHFVVDKAAREGKEPPHWMTRTFVDFLALYGHFGGEDLSDDEGEEDEFEDRLSIEEEGSTGIRRRRRQREEDEDDETSPLIRKAQANAVQGTATPAKAVFLLLKSFVGTGVMFLPKAFYNGGLFFSTALLTTIAAVSLYTFLLLVETRNKVPVSFGDIGGILYGKRMRMAVLIAITFSQIGFVCAYMVFVAQNMQALVEALSNCEIRVPLSYLILGQIAIFVPLAMIRKIQKLSAFALIADLFILLGLICLYYYDFSTLMTLGIGNVEWIINAKSFPMFIGTAVFTYEGVGLVIPITESMKEPEKFPKVLSYTMIGITTIFLSVGFFSYLAFGNNVQTVILLNLPGTAAVNTVQALYALAICLSIPLQLFPAIRITENALFSKSGKNNPVVKWQKNVFRFAAVLACASIAIIGSGDLDKFVSLVGSLCCVPLCFLFPPLFHLKAIANTWRQKVIDISILIFGILSMTYTTGITIVLWSQGGDEAPISRCIPGN